MTGYVLDASVAFAWYLPESFSAAARGYRDRVAAGKIRCVVPGLRYLEVANALRTRVRPQQIAEELARQRRVEDFPLDELTAELDALNDLIVLELSDAVPGPSWYLALYDHIAMTVQFGIDEIYDVYDELA